MRYRCEAVNCQIAGTHVRHYRRAKPVPIGRSALRSWPICQLHIEGLGDLINHDGDYILPIIYITPHSPEHVALECAFATLAGGLYTPIELARLNTTALRDRQQREGA